MLFKNLSLFGQIYPNIIVEGLNITNGQYNYCSHGCIISPFNINQSLNIIGPARVMYTAGRCIELLPGFSASASISSLPVSNGVFETNIAPQTFPVEIIVPTTIPTTKVGLFDKIELGLDLPPIIDNLVAAYFLTNNLPTAINPFDPEDISITASFVSPSGTKNRIIHGFYYEDFGYSGIGDSLNWISKDSSNQFRVRFAPTELGLWSCNIRVSSPKGKFPTLLADCIYFTSIPSNNKGYLQVGLHKRQLKFSGTGESFFAIGQNIPWIHHMTWNSNIFYVSEFSRYYQEINNLSQSGGNFVRIVMAPWSHAIEWEKLGDYRKTDQIPSGTPLLLDQNRQHNAFELDKVFELCEQNNVYINLCTEMHTNYTASPPTVEPAFSWGLNCYNTVGISQPLDVLINANAKKYFQRRLRYMIARWGYSTSLGVLELLSEQDGWDNYNNSTTAVTDSYNWHAVMINYIKSILGDNNHLISTSYADRPSSAFALNSIDVSSGHKYGVNKHINHDRYNYLYEYPPTGSINGLLKDYNKPTIFGELGVDDSARVDMGDLEGCNDVSFHNSLWATAFMGCYGTGLNWWQDYNDNFRSQNYPALKNFFNGLDFESNKFIYAQRWWNTALWGHQYNAEVFALTNFNKEKIMGWVHNATYWWGNISQNCLPGTVLPSDNDTYNNPLPYFGPVLLTNLKILKRYDIDWYHTRNAGSLYSSVTKWTDIFGMTRPFFPGPDADYAFKANKRGTSFRNVVEEINPPLIDSLLCGEDTIYIEGIYEDDTEGINEYKWNFGNGQKSNTYHSIVYYTKPGKYNVKLTVTTPEGKKERLSQVILVPNCKETNLETRIDPK